MRFLRVCAGNSVKGEFDQPVVQNDSTGIISLAVEAESLTLTAGGGRLVLVEGEASEVKDFVAEGTRMRLEAKRARVTRSGATLRVLLLDIER